MNKKRRDKLRQANKILYEVVQMVGAVKDDEQDSIDNTPENLQGGEIYERKEQAVANIEIAIDYLNRASEEIDEAISC